MARKGVTGGMIGPECFAVRLECGGDLMGSTIWYNEAIKGGDVCCVELERRGWEGGLLGTQVARWEESSRTLGPAYIAVGFPLHHPELFDFGS